MDIWICSTQDKLSISPLISLPKRQAEAFALRARPDGAGHFDFLFLCFPDALVRVGERRDVSRMLML